jgi:hypothetical protein
VYGSCTGTGEFALAELYRAVQSFLPYVLEVRQAEEAGAEILGNHLVLLGTPTDNPLIGSLVGRGLLRLPDHPDGFAAACLPSPWQAECKVLVIAGRSPQGALYGVETLNAQVLASRARPDKITSAHLRQALDGLADFYNQDFPRLAQRGIWTWGYVIYDYRRFLDAMARLRMNLLTIWNDVPPVNAGAVIDYAHERGIQVVLGFPWGWGMDYNLADAGDRQKIKEMVLAHYCRHIAPLPADGIYFQTLTEHGELSLGGRSVASLTCELVNEVAAALLEINPTLKINFGLHATSIRARYLDLAPLDQRVTIVWEDAGCLPYTYLPTVQVGGAPAGGSFGESSFEQTVAYSQALAQFRPGTPFAMVAKGWTTLDWPDEFEHHSAYLLGVRSRSFTRQRLEQIQPRWDKVNALWSRYYRYGVEFYRSMIAAAPDGLTVMGLVEDGLLEERIQPSVALFAETMWNPERDPEDIYTASLSPYYR